MKSKFGPWTLTMKLSNSLGSTELKLSDVPRETLEQSEQGRALLRMHEEFIAPKEPSAQADRRE